jgi:hypothetical protein
MMIFARVIQAVMVLVPLVLFGWLLNQELVPSGVFEVTKRVGEPSPYIDRILPDNRVEEVGVDDAGDRVRTILGDPAFFFVHPHRGFDEVRTDVWFKNDGVPIVELGGLVQPDGEIYDLKPLQNTIIDHSDWDRMRDDQTVLLQREPTYDSIDAFLSDPPPRNEISTYHFDLEKPYRMDGYQPQPGTTTIDTSLRGFYTFKTYVKDEPVDFIFEYMDMNRDRGPDPVEVVLFNERNEHVKTVTAKDDGERGDEAFASGLREVELRMDDVPEGVYRVVMRVNKDIFTRRIVTEQHKIVFLDNVYLGDHVGYREDPQTTRFWTEAKSLAFQTHHAERAQDIQVGSQSVALETPFERVEHDVSESGVVRVTVPESDVIVHTTGHIAFAPDQFFNPDPIRLRHDTDFDALGVDYVIADYTPPETNGDWKVASATFDAGVLAKEEGTWKFAFSTPGIEEVEGRLNVGRIDMEWIRDPLTADQLKREIKQLFADL